MDGYKITVLSLSSLREYYKRGMEDRAQKNTENDRIKYARLKIKYEALNEIISKPQRSD